MDKRDENKLVTMKALRSYLNLNNAIWGTSEPMTTAVTELENLIGLIETIRKSTDVDQSGLVTEKRTIRANVVNKTFELVSQMFAMASKTKNQVLLGKISFSKSELDGQRDGGLASTCKTVVDLARENLEGLAIYDITAAGLETLDGLIVKYENSLPTPRLSVSERKANNEKMKGLFRSSKEVLNDQIKRLMIRYKETHPDFYAGYLNASKVVDYGTRYDKPEGPAMPE
ncbi:MAG: hypothetical protein K0M50_18845 [Prolixibacteraceae bacterium]|nr:hypothetical protein [Prolixibacteraceae bacterium]